MPATPKTTPARTMTYDSQLIEDYLHLTKVLVDTGKDNPLAAILNNSGQSEALALHTDGQLYHVCREPLSDSGWNMYGIGAGMSVVANASANTFWSVGTDSALWRNDGGRWTQVATTLPSNLGIESMSLGTDGILYAADGAIDFNVWWSPDNGQHWNALLSFQNSTLPVGSADSLWAMDIDHNVYWSSGAGSWQQIPVPETVGQLCVGFDGTAFVLGQSYVWQYVGQQWQQVSSANGVAQIAPFGAGNVWAIVQTGSQTYGVQQYTNGQWQLVASPLSTGNPSNPPAVSVAADGSVCCVDSYGVVFKYLGDGTWQRQTVPTGMPGYTATLGGVDELAAGQDAAGVQHAFFIASGTLYHACLEPNGGWSFDSLMGCSGLGATYQHDTHELIAYGASQDGNLLIVRDGGGGWNGTEWPASSSLQNATIQLNAINGDSWYTFVLINGGLTTAFGSPSNPLGADSSGVGQLWPVSAYPDTRGMPAISRLARLPMFGLGTVYVGLIDPSDNLYFVSKIGIVNEYPIYQAFGIVEQLSGGTGIPLGSVTSTAGVLGPDGRLRIYATDTQDKLWILRQTGTDSTQNTPWFTWSAWHPLGDGALYLANGPGSAATSDLYTLDADSFLVYMSQNAATGQWSSQPIKKPLSADEPPDYIPQYVTQVTVLDANQVAESGVPVTVTSEEPVSVWVEGVQNYVDAATPLTVVTTELGTVTLTTPALGLHTPKLTFQADGFASAQPVYPPQHIHDRLATVDGPTLSTATAQTQGLPPVTQPLSSNPNADCSGAAQAMNQVFQIPIKAAAPPGKVRCRVVDRKTASALMQLRKAAPGSGAAAPAGEDPDDVWESFWQDLANYGEDIYHGIRTGAMQVVGVTVDLEYGAVYLTISIEGIGQRVLQFWITTAQDVANALHSFFAYIEAAVESALDWLKELFAWQDIVNTKTVLEYYLNQALGNIVADLDPKSQANFQSVVQAQFKTLISQVGTAFANAESTFAKNSFNDFANGATQAARARGVRLAFSNPLQPTEMTSAYQANKVRVDYVHAKAHTYFQTGGALNGAGAAGALPSEDFSDLLNLIDTKILQNDSFQQMLQNLPSTLQAALANPQALFDMAICDFLALAKDFCNLVLTLLEEVIVLVLNLAGEAIGELQALLNTPISIPSISYIYQQISGHPLTLLDLGCLALAMPATIIYKASWGGPNENPPFTTDPTQTDINQVSDITNYPIPWPQIGSASPALRGRPRLGNAPSLEVVLGIEYCTMSIAVGATDVWTDFAASKTKTPNPFVTFFSCCNIVSSVVAQALCIPYEVIEKPVESRTEADWLYLSVWSAGFVPSVVNALFTIFSNSKAMAKFADKWGVPVTTVTGGALLGLGIWAAIEEGSDSDYNAFYQAQAIVSPIPLVAKPLLMVKNNIALGILCGLDLVCDIGSGGLGYAEATS